MSRQLGFSLPIEESSPLSDINTTPLVDVMLVLLIVLLLSLPPITHATLMDMPHVDGTRSKQPAYVSLEVDFDGTIYWNEAPLNSMQQLDSYLHSLASETPQSELRIKANRRARYDTVAQVLAAAQRAGVRRMGFVGNEQFIE